MLNTELLLWCNSNGNVHLSCFVREIPFFDKFVSENEIVCLVKLGVGTNLNMLNLMAMFRFYLLDRKYPFWTKWNLVARLLWIWWIRLFCSFLLFCTENTHFGQIRYAKTTLSIFCHGAWRSQKKKASVKECWFNMTNI